MWILLSLLAAVSTAGREGFIKTAMGEGDEYVVAVAVGLLAAVILVPALLLVGLPERIGPGYLPALLGSGAVNALAAVLIARALHRSDLSLVSPLQSFTPAFMLLTSPIILGEFPSATGVAGVVTIVAGSYLLNVQERGRGPLEPFRALARDAGARAMLLVAFVYSISAVLDKVGVLNSSPLFWGVTLQTFVAATVLPFAVIARRRRRLGGPLAGGAVPAPDAPAASGGGAAPDPVAPDGGALPAPDAQPASGGSAAAGMPAGARGLAPRHGPSPRALLAAGLLTAIAIAAQMTALTLTLAAFVIAVKRTSILFSVLAGHVFFRESGLRNRLAGAAIMLAGFLLVTLS